MARYSGPITDPAERRRFLRQMAAGKTAKARGKGRRKNPAVAGVDVTGLAIDGAGVATGVFLMGNFTEFVEGILAPRLSGTARGIGQVVTGLGTMGVGKWASDKTQILPVYPFSIVLTTLLWRSALVNFGWIKEAPLEVEATTDTGETETLQGYRRRGRLTGVRGRRGMGATIVVGSRDPRLPARTDGSFQPLDAPARAGGSFTAMSPPTGMGADNVGMEPTL